MDQVAQVRQKIDLASLIQEYLPLKKMGRNFKTNCPFHGEKTPSFVVSPERQIWHCFGCQKGGDAFTFLMEYEHIEFPEALRILAQKSGVVLERQQFDSGLSSKKERLYAINHLAAEFYHYLLTKHPLGKEALNYVTKKRHLKLPVLKTFLVGYAPKTSNALVSYLIRKKGYTKEDVLTAGLAYERGGRLYDFFHERIIFALFDHRDNVVGFSGRVLVDRQDTSKYINTRETLVYHKGDTFFGFNTAKDAIKKQKEIILTEGEFDVIASFQEGISNVVAVKGTALTENQVQLLSRFVQNVAVCFDMDKAGQDALKRSIPLLEKKGLQTYVIVLPNGKDPDESIQDNPITYKKAVKDQIPVYDFLLDQSIKEHTGATVQEKRIITSELLPLFGNIENEIVKEHYLHELGNRLDISQDALQKEVDKQKKQTILKKEVPAMTVTRNRTETLEEYLTALIVQSDDPASLLTHVSSYMSTYVWSIPSFQKILKKLEEEIERGEYSQKHFIETLPKELESAFDTCFLLPVPVFSDKAHVGDEVKRVAKDIQQIFLRKQIKIVGEAINQQEKDGSIDELENLQKQLSQFVTLLSEKK